MRSSHMRWASRRSTATLVLACTIWATSALVHSGVELRDDDDGWRTDDHSPGMCAMAGICGIRPDKDVLNCAANVPSQRADAASATRLAELCPTLWSQAGGRVCCTPRQIDAMEKGLRMAAPFIIGCPACAHNFKHLFCTLFCSPDQATFTDVASVQRPSLANGTCVREVNFYLAERFKRDLYDSCKDVVFGASGQKAMTYIGDGATTAQELLEFLGMVKDKKAIPVGSPFQMDFPVTDGDVPAAIAPFDGPLPSCADPGFRCSCGDCPAAPGCRPAPQPPPPPSGPAGCERLGLGGSSVTCTDVLIWLPGFLVLLAMLTLYLHRPAGAAMPRAPSGVIRNGSSHRLEESLLASHTLAHPPASVHASEVEYDSAFTSRGPDSALPAIEGHIRHIFRRLGRLVAHSPLLILLGALTLVAVCMSGLVALRVETAPLRLWVAPDSTAATDKAAYDDAFGPFYRIEQIIITTPRVANGTQQPILTPEAIDLVFDIHEALDSLEPHWPHSRVIRKDQDRPVTLQDVCYKPFGSDCAIESVAQYWQLNRSHYENPRASKLDFCLSHWSTACRSAFEAPIDPKLVLGGFPTDDSFRSYLADATALLITIPVNATGELTGKARLWEAAFLKEMEDKIAPMVRSKGLEVAFSSERSVQDELNRESYTDAATVAFSYLAMFLYIAFALTRVPPGTPWLSTLVYTRTGLAAAGVLIVLCSVLGALGLCSMLGIWSTLIIMEVIPFLVLAVGVDNMFILALLDARQPSSAPLPERVADTLASAGPSILLASVCEAVAFGVAATAAMPAVRNFAICAMIAVILDFVLQVTAFMAVLTMDTARMQRGGADCMPCFQTGPPSPSAPSTPLRDFEVTDSEPHSPTSADGSEGAFRQPPASTWLQRYMGHTHAPFLARPTVKLLVLVAFTLLALTSLTLMQRLEAGLDQAVALPRDSYLQQYYRTVLEYARVGPPVMFVIEDIDLHDDSPDASAICASAGCDDDSVMTQITEAARQPASTYLATPAASWLDDYLAWVQPQLSDCCRMNTTDDGREYCPPPDQPPCSAQPAACEGCATCLAADELRRGRPTLEATRTLLPWFLQAAPSAACAKGGRGVYTDQLSTAGLQREGRVTASFRAFSTPLSRQADFVGALRATRDVVAHAQSKLDAARADSDPDVSTAPRVYAYSVFHPFFEQYLTIAADATHLLGVACAAVFVVTVLLTGSVWLAAIIFGCLALMLIDMMGAMVLMGVQLNAISLVNLAMSLGIGVEFMAHVAHSYRLARGSREKRVSEALVDMGASVCAGILLTKLVGVAVLAFSRTQVFEVYYFRMYLSLVVLGGAHGLVLLPVLLSIVGPPELRSAPVGGNRMELLQPVTHRQPVFIHRQVSPHESDTQSGSNTSRASVPGSENRDGSVPDRVHSRGSLVGLLRSPPTDPASRRAGPA